MTIRCILAGVLLSGSAVLAADWPQFAGADRINVSTEKGLLKSWPEAGPRTLWTTSVGEGFGGAAIRDGQVFVLDRDSKAGKDILRCLELASGKELWTYSYDAPGKTGYNGSRAVPAVTEKHVFSIGPFGHLKCVDRASHEMVWEANIVAPGSKPPAWAYAQSPLPYKQSIIVSTQSKTGITAYDQATGKVLWESSARSAPYCSPTLITLGGVEQVVMTHGGGVDAVDPATGKTLWSYSGWKCGIPIPNVTRVGDDKVFITGGYKAGSVMIQVNGNTAKELWRSAKGTQIHQPIVLDGAIYLNGTTNDTPNDGLICMDVESGNILWQNTNPKMDRGNLIYADGLLYVIDAAGTLNLVEPDKTAYKRVSFAKLLGGRDIWAPMALSDGKLVIRDQAQMKCLDLKAQ